MAFRSASSTLDFVRSSRICCKVVCVFEATVPGSCRLHHQHTWHAFSKCQNKFGNEQGMQKRTDQTNTSHIVPHATLTAEAGARAWAWRHSGSETSLITFSFSGTSWARKGSVECGSSTSFTMLSVMTRPGASSSFFYFLLEEIISWILASGSVLHLMQSHLLEI